MDRSAARFANAGAHFANFYADVATDLARYPEIGPGVIGRVIAKIQRQHLNPPNFHGGSGKCR